MLNIRKLVSALAFSAIALALVVARASGQYDEDYWFHAYPNPFTVGFNETTIYYELPDGSEVSILVYDFDGHLVRTILDNERHRRGGPFQRISWDGRDDAGEEVAPGPYTMVLEVRAQGQLIRKTFVSVVNK
jgi:hypothetical protein